MANVEITDYLRANGSLNYPQLKKLAARMSPTEFGLLFRRPLVVGMSVTSGDFHESKVRSDTMVFNLDELEAKLAEEQEGSLQSAIFMLHKQNRGDGKPNIIAIGRSNDNDLVMNDYSISREHAIVRIQANKYFLTDLGATNGTEVNEDPLMPQGEVEIKAGDVIGFGRYRFRFMRAELLHKRLVN